MEQLERHILKINMKKAKKENFFQKHKFLILIVLLSCVLMFSNLGNRYMTGDDCHTALMGEAIQEYGYPYAYHDGQIINYKETYNLIHSGEQNFTDYSPKLTENGVWREQPWLYFYIEALSFELFGANTFSAKFPFALIGIFTILLFYFFARKMTRNEQIAKVSSILMATSTIFYLFSRQARYFTILMFCLISILWSYTDIINYKNNKKTKSFILFTAFLVILFHTNYAVFFPIIFGLVLHFFIFRHYKKNLKNMFISLAVIFALTFPWFYLTDSFSLASGESAISSMSLLYFSMGFFYLFFILGFPLIFIPIMLPFFRKENKTRQNYILFLFITICFMLILSFHNEFIPLRYLIVLLPIVILMNGSAIVKVMDKNRIIGISLMILLIFSNILYIFPFNFIQDTSIVNKAGIGENLKSGETDISYFLSKTFAPKLLVIDYLYEITHNYDNAEEVLIKYMRENGKSGDRYISLGEGLHITLMFYTDFKHVETIDELKTAPPEWIIYWLESPRVYSLAEEHYAFLDFVEKNINLEDYEKIQLNISNTRFAETPDIIHHKFKTDYNGNITIYHKS